MSATGKSAASSVARLREWFNESGWVQGRPDAALRARYPNTYKRGYEVRLSAPLAAAPGLTRLLRRAGFKPGAPFRKGTRVIVPLYGREQTQRFLKVVNSRAARGRASR